MLAHVAVPPDFTDDQPDDHSDDHSGDHSDDTIFDTPHDHDHDGSHDGDHHGDRDGHGDRDAGSRRGTATAGGPTTRGTGRAGTDSSPDGAIGVTVGIIIDLRTYLDGLDRLLGHPTSTGIRPPFGPDRAVSHTIDGVLIDPRDAVLASLHAKTRLIITDDTGLPIQITSTARLFTGRLRDAVLTTAVRCTHPGCLRPATRSQIDHLTPHSHGGPTSIHNAGLACTHHNHWRYLTNATTHRHPNGTYTTHRRDGTDIAPPD